MLHWLPEYPNQLHNKQQMKTTYMCVSRVPCIRLQTKVEPYKAATY